MTDGQRHIIVGCGGTGGWLAEGLVRMLEFGKPGSILMLVDGDNFEPKNKARQNFRSAGNKANVLAAQIAPAYDQTFVVPIPKWVVADPEDLDESVLSEEVDIDGNEAAGRIAASELLSENCVVYAVVDNYKARKDICDAAKNYDNIDVFLGGNDDRLAVDTYHYRRRNGQDVTDHPATYREELENPPDRNPGELSCAERAEIDGGTQFIAANMLACGMLLAEVQVKMFEDNHLDKTEKFLDMEHGIAQPFDRVAEKEAALV